MSGEFSQAVNALLEKLIHLRMLVEATLAFPEEDIDFLQKADAQGQLDRLRQTLATVMQRSGQGAILREGIKLVIAGQPNAGKSSLLNALAGAELAIVTPIAGTTRDKVVQLFSSTVCRCMWWTPPVCVIQVMRPMDGKALMKLKKSVSNAPGSKYKVPTRFCFYTICHARALLIT